MIGEKICVNPRPPLFKFAANTFIAFVASSLQLCASFIRIRQHTGMRCILKQDDFRFRLLIVDLCLSREMEVEKETRLEKNSLQADRLPRYAGETQKEKDARLKKIAFEAPTDIWIKMRSIGQQQMYL